MEKSRIIRGVKKFDTVQEGIEEALERQKEIDSIQSTKQREAKHFDDKKTIEAGKKEIQKKIEREHRRKFFYSQEAKKLLEQKLLEEGKGGKPLGVVKAKDLIKGAPVMMPQKELLTGEEKQQLIIDYIDSVMQMPEYWTGRMEKPDEKPQKEEIELLQVRKFQGMMGYLIKNRNSDKIFFVPDLQNLTQRLVDKLPAEIKIKFKLVRP